MKYIGTLLLFVFLSFSNLMNAQDSNNLKVGEILRLEAPENYDYTHIKLPRANFIIKKGGIANYKKLDGTRVEITKIKISNNKIVVLLKRKNGKKFFGSFPVIRANYKEAIASGELSR